MVAVFCQVTAEVSPDFIENFPAQFDFIGMLTRICEDVGVKVSLLNEVYNIQGQWHMIGRAHNMLVSTLAVYGSSSSIRKEHEDLASKGSRPFSALVEAAEAISRGVELQEQVQHEMMHMKNLNQIPSFTGESIPSVPAAVPIPGLSNIPENVVSKVSDASIEPVTQNSLAEEKSVYEVSNIAYVQPENKPCLTIGKDLDSCNDSVEGSSSLVEEAVVPCDKDEDWQIENSGSINDTGSSTDETDVSIDKTIKSESDADHDEEKTEKTESIMLKKNVTSKKTTKNKSKKLPKSKTLQSKNIVKLEPGPVEKPIHQKKGRPLKRIKNEDGNDIYPCDECNFIGKTRNNLGDHKHRVHLAEPTQCDICNKIFPNMRYMKRHRSSHNEPQHCCDICGKQYKVLKALKDHKKRHDNSYIKPEFACSMCSKTFCSNYILECHVKSEHMGLKKHFLCQTCGKSFTTKHTLQQHANVHVGARPYQCEDCGKSFSYESALRDHKYIHEGTKKFVCEFPLCKKAFRQRSALKMHEKIHKDMKDFQCPECDRGFTQKQALQRHIRAHKGLKPFSCKHCGRKFGDASIIRRHMILVHKIHKDPTKWREDIESNSHTVRDAYYVKSEAELLQAAAVQPPPTLSSLEQTNFAEKQVVNMVASEPKPAKTWLPPVAVLQTGYSTIDNYSSQEFSAAQTLSVSDQSVSLPHQFNVNIPPHPTGFLNMSTQTPVTNYNYTVTSLQLPQSDKNTLSVALATPAAESETPKPDSHLTQIDHAYDARIAPAKQSIQYLDDPLDVTYSAVVDVNKLQKSIEVLTKPGLNVQQTVACADLTQVPKLTVSDESQGIVMSKDDQETHSEHLALSQFYAYYSNLSQYASIGQYPTGAVVQSDSTTNNHLS